MKPDRETYEAWLLDRMEGKLTAAQEAVLDAFLRLNPDLVAGSGELPTVADAELEFPAKDLLRKTYPPTGRIDANKLDDFLVARLEKELDPEQEKQLERYLYEHPESERQAALMALAKVPNELVPFAEKETVERYFPPKGMPDAHRLTDFLIADLEGDLSATQQQALKQFVADNKAAQHQQRLVAAVRVVPEAWVYADKAGLKKRESRVVALWPRLAAAASIALLLSAGWWLLRERPTDNPEVARVEKQVQPVEPATKEATVPARNVVQPNETAAPTHATDGEPKTGTAPASRRQDVVTPKEKPRESPNGQQQPKEQPGILPSPQIAPSPLPDIEPELAQHTPEPVPADTAHAGNPSTARPGTDELAMANPRGSDQSLATFVANTLRNDVLDKPQRAATLDGGDALALADKALGAVTGGQGGVKVQRTSVGERFQVRLGRNLSISASRGR